MTTRPPPVLTLVHPTSTSDPEAYDLERGDHVELAERLLEDVAPAGSFVYDEGSPYTYDATRGTWAELPYARESQIVQSYAGASVAPKGRPLRLKASDVAGAIKLAHDRAERPGFFASAPPGLAFNNGFVRLAKDGTIELLPHDREHRARAAYPFAFEAGALPRGFLSFLGDLFRDDEDRVEKELVVQEFFGAAALGIAPRYQRCIVAIGGGSNGKSRLADGMIAAMPEGTTSAIAPQDWGQEYRRAMLAGKRLNAVGELPERDILASEAFKAIVAGDPIVGRQIREAPVTFAPIAAHYFAANSLPGTPDQSDGFWRRFIVLTFNRSFKNDPRRDPHVMDRILATEKPAIVSWLIEGAARLVRSQDYTIPASHHEALAKWRKNADQIALFVEAETRQVDPTDGAFAADLYAAYRQWATENGHRAMASNRFGRRMHEIGYEPHKTNVGRRYPLALLTASEKRARDAAESDASDVGVTWSPSPKSEGFSNG